MEQQRETHRITCLACVARGDGAVAFAVTDGTNEAAAEWIERPCPICSWTPDGFMAVMEAFEEVAREEANHFTEAPWQVLGLRIGRHLVGGYPSDPHKTVDALREGFLDEIDRKRPGAEAFAARRNWRGFLLLFSSAFREMAGKMLVEYAPECERDAITAAML